MDLFLGRVINYISFRLQGVVQYKHLIKHVEISCREYHSFRNDLYYLVDFEVSFIRHYKKQLTEKELAEIERLLRMSERMSPYDYETIERNLNTPGGHFIPDTQEGQGVGFLISTGGYENGPYSRDQYLNRLKDFASTYNTLCLFTTHFVHHLAPDIRLNIRSLDAKPEINCLKKFWNELTILNKTYSSVCHTDFDRDVDQYMWLQRKQENNLTWVSKFTLTDIEIYEKIKLNINVIRDFVLREDVPFLIEGGKTIDKVLIDAHALRNALLNIQGQKSNFFHDKLLTFVEEKINKQDLTFLRHERKLKKFLLVENDIIYTKENKIAKVITIKFVNGQYNCIYRLINKNLQIGQREGECNPVKEVEKILRGDLFESLKLKYNWKHYRQLEGHFQNKVKSIDWSHII